MINGINSSSEHIQITGGTGQTPIMSNGNYGAGSVRWNPNFNSFEVNDGIAWKQFIMSTANIQLSAAASAAISWAIRKMQEEDELLKLAETTPALKAAVENLNEAKKQLETTKILSSK